MLILVTSAEIELMKDMRSAEYRKTVEWMNKNATDYNVVWLETVSNIKPSYLKSAKINGQFKFIGVQTDFNKGTVNIYEIPLIFLLLLILFLESSVHFVWLLQRLTSFSLFLFLLLYRFF